MSRGAALVLGALFAVRLLAAETAFDDPVLNERYWGLIREIRCPLCLNESIADSGAPVAADLRREVHRLVAEGKSDEEVKEFLSSRYGDFVLYRPRVEPVTYALWGAPFFLLLVGAFVFWRVLRVRRNQPLDEDDVA
jgi:cytochrome c-type biogenesis protein CcmH